MSDPLVMPARRPNDPGVSIRHNEIDDTWRLWVGDDGVTFSPYNGWRLVGMLCLTLGIPLAKHVAKAIKF